MPDADSAGASNFTVSVKDRADIENESSNNLDLLASSTVIYSGGSFADNRPHILRSNITETVTEHADSNINIQREAMNVQTNVPSEAPADNKFRFTADEVTLQLAYFCVVKVFFLIVFTLVTKRLIWQL